MMMQKLILYCPCEILYKYKEKGGFLKLQLSDLKGNIFSENLYWYPNSENIYNGLDEMKKVELDVSAKFLSNSQIEISVNNKNTNPVAFFNRIALIDKQTGKRILPAFYSDNYVSIIPGETRKIVVEYLADPNIEFQLEVYGWNVDRFIVNITNK